MNAINFLKSYNLNVLHNLRVVLNYIQKPFLHAQTKRKKNEIFTVLNDN